MNTIAILGVKVDEVTKSQAIELVSDWLKKGEKNYIVTPNIEFVMAAQKDPEFKKVINAADLSIPDSARFNWAKTELESNLLKRLLLWPLFFFPKSSLLQKFPITTGTDLMAELIEEAEKNNWTVGLLGGKEGIAEKLKQKLEKKYPNLKITFAQPGGVIDQNGEVLWVDPERNEVHEPRNHNSVIAKSKSDQAIEESSGFWTSQNDSTLKTEKIKNENHEPRTTNQKSYQLKISNFKFQIPETDILFVAFGHGKQEKWIAKNLEHYPVRVMMGVGGAFDYLSGSVPRAPKSWQKYGFEWLYRLLLQPWRAKRFLSLIQFVFLIISSRSSKK